MIVQPDSVALAEAATEWTGAYVHVPFCARICPYCDFNVVADRADLHDRFISATVSHIVAEDEEGAPLDAVAVGGGTPSRLNPANLKRILDALRDRFSFSEGAEVSIEVNPEDWTSMLADGLARAGVTRISFGVQSFDDTVLDALGRLHSSADVDAAVGSARRYGFSTVSIDLIYGTPGETAASWDATLERALALQPDHISLYALTVERGTALSRAIAAGAPAPDEDDQADKYEAGVFRLSEQGFVRYEVSNFAQPGHADKYNLLTWAQSDYLGFGPGAHGHVRGRRYRNIHRVDAYLSAVEEGRSPLQGEEHVLGWAREQERLLLGLRRSAGVEIGSGGRSLLETEWGERLAGAGVLRVEAGRIIVARPLLGSEVARAVLALSPVEC